MEVFVRHAKSCEGLKALIESSCANIDIKTCLFGGISDESESERYGFFCTSSRSRKRCSLRGRTNLSLSFARVENDLLGGSEKSSRTVARVLLASSAEISAAKKLSSSDAKSFSSSLALSCIWSPKVLGIVSSTTSARV